MRGLDQHIVVEIWLISRTSCAESDLEEGEAGHPGLRLNPSGSAGRSATQDANAISRHPSSVLNTD
jgi:hypothetical protein